jgi:hypothetical protein
LTRVIVPWVRVVAGNAIDKANVRDTEIGFARRFTDFYEKKWIVEL